MNIRALEPEEFYQVYVGVSRRALLRSAETHPLIRVVTLINQMYPGRENDAKAEAMILRGLALTKDPPS
jgi:hypothetical protein